MSDVYADGIGNVRVAGTNVRIDLLIVGPETDDEGKPVLQKKAELIMPLQGLISEPALGRISKLSESGHEGAKALATYWVGQAVGLMNEPTTSKQVVYDFMEDFGLAIERVSGLIGKN